jgi:RHS repeat-associated protein
LTSIQDALGNVTTLGYGQGSCGCPNGEKLTSLHTPDLPTSAQWAFTYNADGLLSTSADPTGASRSLTYTPTRDVSSVTDALSRQTLFTYDQLGRQKTITDALSRIGVFAYPVPGNSVIAGPSVYAGSPSLSPAPTDLNAALADGQYQVGQNNFATASFPAQIEFYRDATFAFSLGRQFDYNGRLTLREDRVGLPFSGSPILPTTTSQYRHQLFSYLNNNDWSSLLSYTESDYGDHYESESNNYNTELDLTSDTGWTVNTANYTFTPDTAGRPSAIATRFQGQINNLTASFDGPSASYSYNPSNGQLTSVTNGTGTQALGYDARGLRKTINLTFPTSQSTPQAEGVFTFQYDAVGRNTRLDYPDGHFRTQSYDLVGRLTSRCYDGYPAPAPARCYSAQYDTEGNPTTLDDPEGHNEVFYDALDRVTQVWRTPKGGSRTLEEDYTYNALGALSKNVDTIVDDKRPTLSGSGTASAGIPATHNGQPVTLDPGGQVTAFDGAALTFNKRAWLTNFSQGTTAENYGYDAFSRRVMRNTGGVTGDFYSYEGANIVAVTNSASINGNIPSAVQRRILYEGVDQPLWMYDASLFSSVYFETDTVGNVRRLRGGKVPTGLSASPQPSDLGGYRYTAFGHLVTTDTTTPYPTAAGQRYDQPLRWQSHWFIDVGSGVYDFRARVWSPELAAFLQPDEFGFLGRSGTLWSWPGQNPYKWRDPTGRAGIAFGVSGDAGFCFGLCGGSWAGSAGVYVGTEGIGVFGSGQGGLGTGAHAGYGLQGSVFSSLDAFSGASAGAEVVAGYGVVAGGSLTGNASGEVLTVSGGAGGGLYAGAIESHTWTYGLSWADIAEAWHLATKQPSESNPCSK